MKKYRKIRSSDKLPNLPKTITPVFLFKGKYKTLIFGESKEKRYTIVWDGISTYPISVTWNLK